MEHAQKEFIVEQLKCINKMIEASKSSESLPDKKGIYHLSMKTSSTVLNKELITSTQKGVVIKSYPPSLYDQSLREYLIGLKIINPLRKITPCFLHTLGAFKHTDTCIIYESVEGKTLAVMLQEGLSFTNWLCLFIQILLSLEVAQRRTGFTHYDLHAKNVVVRKNQKDSYCILLDNLSYCIQESALIPVIVDLGTSSTSLEGRFIGSHDYTNSGIFHFIVAGHDMYKLLVSSYCHAKDNNTRCQILSLFEFFEMVDPYKVSLGQGKAGVLKAQKEFCKEVFFSKVASYTPMMMIKYIYSKFNQNLTPGITIVPRNSHSSLLQLDGSENYSQALKSARKLIELKSGYVTAKYILYVIGHSTDPDVRRELEELQNNLEYEKKDKICMDILMLKQGLEIPLPSQKCLKDTRKELLDIPIRYMNASVKEQRFDKLEKLLEYQEKFQPLLDTYFTILELNLIDEYHQWVNSFCQSTIYKFYMANKIENDRAWRWGETLLASIFLT